jgi:anti-sigma regulatory factor (Ser/Thr protein kinase)
MTFPAQMQQLVQIRAGVRQALSAAAWLSETTLDGIVLAVDEACANIIDHGYQRDATKSVTLHVDVEPNRICVHIFDSAPAFDPKTILPPDIDSRILRGQRGGLGIHLMNRSVDEVLYVPAHDASSRNELILTIHRR